MNIVVIPLECGVLHCSVHSLDLTVSPWMVGFGQPMLNPVCVTDHVKTHRPRVCCVSASGLLGELDASVGEDGVDVIRGRLRVSAQGTPRMPFGWLCPRVG